MLKGTYNLGVTRCYGKNFYNKAYIMWDNTNLVLQTYVDVHIKPLIELFCEKNRFYSVGSEGQKVSWFISSHTGEVWKDTVGVRSADDFSSFFNIPEIIMTNMFTYQSGYTEGISQLVFIEITVTDKMINNQSGGDLPSLKEADLSSWGKAYLNDKKMHSISVGKTFQFTKIKNSDGTPHTGGETETFSVDRGGLTAKGFKQNPLEGLFLERSNELLPGTFIIGALGFGSKSGNYLNGVNNIINNATDPLSGVSQAAQAYVRNINENTSNVTKIISQGNIWTGTIVKAKTFMSAVGSGSPASMSLLGAMGFGTMMGLSVIAGIELGKVVVDKVKEYVTPQGTYKLDKYSNLFDVYQTSDYIDDLLQQAEANANGQNERSATTHADKGTNSAEQIDEWEKQQSEAQAQADAQAKEKAEAEKAALELENEKLKSTLLKNATDYLSQITGILDFNFNNIPKKQDILDIDHEESTTTVEELNKAKRNMKAWENLHSQVLDNHTDTQGNEQEFTKGLVGILKSFAPATLNEHLTRITGKNMSDVDMLEDMKNRIDDLITGLFNLTNIKKEDLPSIDSEGLTDFDKELLSWYYSKEEIRGQYDIVKDEEGVV